MSALSICRALVHKFCVASSGKTTLKIFALVLAAAPLTAAAQAQGVAIREQISVSFAFEMGGKHLAAGVYAVEMKDRIIVLRGANVGTLILANVEQNSTVPRQGKIVFRKYGSRYFLREVWMADSSIHFRCLKTKSEQEVLVASTQEPTDAEVAQLEAH